MSEITLKVLQDSRYFPFDCNSVEQKAAMVLNRWAAHATNDRPDSSVLCAATSSSTSPHLYLSAPIADLVKGILHGHEAIGKSLKHGNLGLGTLHMLDGEVVVLDGVAYQQTSEGTCNVIPDESLSPFMMVTSFDNALAQQVTLRGPLDLEGLQERLLSTLRTKNVFWALKISGRFDYLKCRAVRYVMLGDRATVLLAVLSAVLYAALHAILNFLAHSQTHVQEANSRPPTHRGDERAGDHRMERADRRDPGWVLFATIHRTPAVCTLLELVCSDVPTMPHSQALSLTCA